MFNALIIIDASQGVCGTIKGFYQTFCMCLKTIQRLYMYMRPSPCYSFVVVLVAKLHLTLLRPHGLQPARLLCPWDFPGKNTGVGYYFPSGNLPNTGTEPTSPALASGFFTTELPKSLLSCIRHLLWDVSLAFLLIQLLW